MLLSFLCQLLHLANPRRFRSVVRLKLKPDISFEQYLSSISSLFRMRFMLKKIWHLRKILKIIFVGNEGLLSCQFENAIPKIKKDQGTPDQGLLFITRPGFPFELRVPRSIRSALIYNANLLDTKSKSPVCHEVTALMAFTFSLITRSFN